MTTISNPANSIIATVDYGTSLPGRIIGSIANTIERYAEAAAAIEAAPSQFIASVMAGVNALKVSAAPLARFIQSNAAMLLSVRVAYLYDADETQRQRARKLEKVPAWDFLGNYVKPEETGAIMTSTELERSLAQTRVEVQKALDESREMNVLPQIARLLLYHVNQIKLEVEKIIVVDVASPTPLHMLCLRYGLPYTYAERVLAINPQIANPSFVEGTIRIYAR
jgi:prophage DNA circulation protein